MISRRLSCPASSFCMFVVACRSDTREGAPARSYLSTAAYARASADNLVTGHLRLVAIDASADCALFDNLPLAAAWAAALRLSSGSCQCLIRILSVVLGSCF